MFVTEKVCHLYFALIHIETQIHMIKKPIAQPYAWFQIIILY